MVSRKPVRQKIDKREAILEAMLDVVVEQGFHDSPMSVVSKRAGASPGVIYHYFQNKESIIEALYERVVALKRSSLLNGYLPEMDAQAAMVHVWMNAYKFYRKHHREMRFLEQCELAGFVYPLDKRVKPQPVQIEFEKRFRPRVQGGVLANLPPQVLEECTLGMAARLAKQSRELSPAVLNEIAHRIWQFASA